MTPLERYRQDVAFGHISGDAAQEQAIEYLQRVYVDLIQQPKKSWWDKLTRKQIKPVKGVYLWGSVGGGKTYLMDTFFESLPFPEKKREHFHYFMRDVHAALKRHEGTVNPLIAVAQEFAIYKILCFDEFFVNDIGDAMLLGNLFKTLFSLGVTLVATSNIHPDVLYKNGLQRDLFLPAIALLHECTEIAHVEAAHDYRLRKLSPAGVYFYPLNNIASMHMRQLFSTMAHGHILSEPLVVAGRSISVVQRANNVIWFRFNDICAIPRSQQDYVLLAEKFSTVMMSDIPIIQKEEDNTVIYLINLVDIFYDARVKLIMSADAPLEQLYPEGRKVFEFQRTLSRLMEMQTQEYLQLPRRLDGLGT